MFDSMFFYERGNRNGFYTFIIYKHTGVDRKTQAEKAKNRNQRQEIRGFWAEKGMKGGGKYTYRIQKHTLLKEKKRFIQEEMAHFSTAKKRKEEKKKTKPDEERKKENRGKKLPERPKKKTPRLPEIPEMTRFFSTQSFFKSVPDAKKERRNRQNKRHKPLRTAANSIRVYES